MPSDLDLSRRSILAGALSATAGAAPATAAAGAASTPAPAAPLARVMEALLQPYPGNRTINIVCHGHSVPAGYFRTPQVRTLDAYPHLLHAALTEAYPYAVINVIVTAIGGEASEAGARRFAADVLDKRPDAVSIDYGLNDRAIGLERAEHAWSAMLDALRDRGIPAILLTPTADIGVNFTDPASKLRQHAEQIRRLATRYDAALADSFAAFEQYTVAGGKLQDLLSQVNHPNRRGHELVARELMRHFWSPRPLPAAR
jgi:acyl-CoA thioesterase I